MELKDYLYTWSKDRHFRYQKCNEAYANAAGLDSPHSIVGKSDDDMPWHSLADIFRTGDQLLMDGVGLGRENVVEKEIMYDRIADILVTETPDSNTAGLITGVSGFFVDITGKYIIDKKGALLDTKKRFDLGPELQHAEITKTQLIVLRELLHGREVPQIATALCKSKRTIEDHVNNLKHILQCRSKREIIHFAISHGLMWIANDIEIGELSNKKDTVRTGGKNA